MALNGYNSTPIKAYPFLFGPLFLFGHFGMNLYRI